MQLIDFAQDTNFAHFLVIFLDEITIPRSDLTQNSTSLQDRRKKGFDEMIFRSVTSERPGKRVVNLIFPMDI